MKSKLMLKNNFYIQNRIQSIINQDLYTIPKTLINLRDITENWKIIIFINSVSDKLKNVRSNQWLIKR